MVKKPGGPAAYLAPGCSWLDARVEFDVPAFEPALAAACRDLWAISMAIRVERGRVRRSAVDVAANAKVRRQTLTDFEVGRSWPDAQTLARICFELGLRLAVVPTVEQ